MNPVFQHSSEFSLVVKGLTLQIHVKHLEKENHDDCVEEEIDLEVNGAENQKNQVLQHSS